MQLTNDLSDEPHNRGSDSCNVGNAVCKVAIDSQVTQRIRFDRRLPSGITLRSANAEALVFEVLNKPTSQLGPNSVPIPTPPRPVFSAGFQTSIGCVDRSSVTESSELMLGLRPLFRSPERKPSASSTFGIRVGTVAGERSVKCILQLDRRSASSACV